MPNVPNRPPWDATIPQRDCGKRSYCGRCATCRVALQAATRRRTDGTVKRSRRWT